MIDEAIITTPTTTTSTTTTTTTTTTSTTTTTVVTAVVKIAKQDGFGGEVKGSNPDTYRRGLRRQRNCIRERSS